MSIVHCINICIKIYGYLPAQIAAAISCNTFGTTQGTFSENITILAGINMYGETDSSVWIDEVMFTL